MIAINSPLYSYQKKVWKDFILFCDYLHADIAIPTPKIFFEGEGFLVFSYGNTTEKHYLFSLNKKLYSSMLINTNNEQNDKFQFNGIIELDSSILDSDFMPKYDTTNCFRTLDAALHVDCKHYDYGTEHKLLISKADKVDLLFSHQLIQLETEATFKAQIYPSLKPAVEWQQKVNEIDARTAKIVAEMKKR
jgi:hypothetical protein